MDIKGIDTVNLISTNHLQKPKPVTSDTSFYDVLKSALNSVNDMEKQVDRSRELLAAGKLDSLHQVMIESEKAGIAVQFTVEIRNKIMDAYNEIMRIQL